MKLFLFGKRSQKTIDTVKHICSKVGIGAYEFDVCEDGVYLVDILKGDVEIVYSPKCSDV